MKEDYSQIQMGTLTSNVTVIDEEQLLTPAQLDKITAAVLQRLEQKNQKQQLRAQDQSIGNSLHSGGR